MIFFGLPLFICLGTLSSLTLLTKFLSSILSRYPSHLSLDSRMDLPEWTFDRKRIPLTLTQTSTLTLNHKNVFGKTK